MEKQRQKQGKFPKPVVSPNKVNRGRAGADADNQSNTSRVFSASPASGLSKLDKIAAAQ
jgi:hypothetical protein